MKGETYLYTKGSSRISKCGEDIYRTDRSITSGWLSDMELKPDTRIAAYALESDDEGEYLA